MAKYLIRTYSTLEKKYYYLTAQQDSAINNYFGACFIFGKRIKAKIFKTKAQALKELKTMRHYGTGANAEIYQINERKSKND